jgi:hypothetical protein
VIDPKPGLTFGRWTVLAEVDRLGKLKCFLCRCACGTERRVAGSHLRRGRSKSCGCQNAEISRLSHTTHGKSGSAEYKIWQGMKRRCSSPNSPGYAYYGGRGIRVCERWMSFENFIADMEPRPDPSYSLDRFPNNDGNYEPGNCRWATEEQQSNNKSSNRLIEFGGCRHTIAEWAKLVRIPRGVLVVRIDREGWDVARALTEPVIHSTERSRARGGRFNLNQNRSGPVMDQVVRLKETENLEVTAGVSDS